MEDRPPADEASLIARARGGDDDAFAGLVSLHGDIVFRTAYLVLGDADEAEDAAQEAFVRAHRALGRFREGEPFRPWLLQIAANAARNRRRAAGRRAELVLRARTVAGTAGAEPSSESVVLDAERRARLLDAIGRLAPDDRLVLSARYFLDLGEAEISAIAGVRRGTVKSRLSRARGRLAAVLARDGEEWRDG